MNEKAAIRRGRPCSELPGEHTTFISGPWWVGYKSSFSTLVEGLLYAALISPHFGISTHVSTKRVPMAFHTTRITETV